jgi:hypothetical protein
MKQILSIFILLTFFLGNLNAQNFVAIIPKIIPEPEWLIKDGEFITIRE